ncbi:two-component system, sensor histidine kinase YesM [Paenibacillus catalpae]|uniref:Two-component system, sensor histidine kinase YesM n=1 Tax=Paenibacillus catalpae TaxID=1045775 RepID=A0A1I2DVF2_9BACL|nr:sensor histidine kinase [Paenibacillus catalpae]SFE84516.1 two-component system, sensor histidine kinase YesM [Paenibacillus catalpae]
MTNHIAKGWNALTERVSSRLVNKLILLFSTIIILVVGSLTFISYKMLQREALKNSIASTSNNLLLVNKNLEDYLTGMEQLSLPQINYDELAFAISHAATNYASKMFVEDYLRNMYFSRSNEDLEAIYLYFVSSGTYYTISKENFDIKIRSGQADNIPSMSWYKQAMDSETNRAYQSFLLSNSERGYDMDPSRSFMAYHRVLRSISTRAPQAVVSFYYNTNTIDNIIKDIPQNKGQHLFFLSPDNVPFVLDEKPFYQSMVDSGLLKQLTADGSSKDGLTWDSPEESKYLVVYNVGEQEGWRLVKPIPYKELYTAAKTTRNLNFLIGLLFLLLAVILITYFSNAVTKPLKFLSQQMKRFSTGDFEASTEVVGRDELAYLSRQFNQMVSQTNELINERYKMKLVEKNAILKALEAEINPHFLYNALQAISTKALKAERFDIADMVDALALTLRYCISGKDIVRASEELLHIERYMSLQKARFGGRLQLITDWDEELKELELPKLSLQTLVENAIKHGVEMVSSTVTIRISARAAGGHAFIIVSDNGPGFAPGRLKEVLGSFEGDWNEQKEEERSVGLVNLNTRLKLLYGTSSQLVIRTSQSGTEMEMLIPRGGGPYV